MFVLDYKIEMEVAMWIVKMGGVTPKVGFVKMDLLVVCWVAMIGVEMHVQMDVTLKIYFFLLQKELIFTIIGKEMKPPRRLSSDF